MPRHALAAIALLLVSLRVLGATDDAGYDEYTIRPSDIPADAPRFEDYPAEVYSGSNAAPDLRSDPTSRLFRTQLKRWAKRKPNFAGRFVLATWGRGVDCTQIAIIDVSTGKVYHPQGAKYNVAVNVDDTLLEPGDRWHASGAIWYRTDSRLLVLIGMPEERVGDRGISYYVWEGGTLKRVRFIPKAWYPEDK